MGEALAIPAAVLFALGTVLQQKRMVERGERAYARWGHLAVFFTPAIVSGTANMKHAQFVLWNLLASLGFAVSVAASAHGLGRTFTGHDSAKDIATLVVASPSVRWSPCCPCVTIATARLRRALRADPLSAAGPGSVRR